MTNASYVERARQLLESRGPLPVKSEISEIRGDSGSMGGKSTSPDFLCHCEKRVISEKRVCLAGKAQADALASAMYLLDVESESLDQYRMEIRDAPPNDPHIEHDREILRLADEILAGRGSC